MKDRITIAYRCPSCGVAMIGEISIFALSGGETNLRCSCGESVMSVSYIKSRDTVSLSVPCVACPTNHPYQVAGSTFRTANIFILQCSASGLDTCFIGDKAEVIKAVNNNTAELERLMNILDERDLEDADFEESDFDLFKNYEEDECDDEECECHHEHNHRNDKYDSYEYADALVTSQMLYIIKEMSENGKIKCNCNVPRDYFIDVKYDSIELSCDVCGASLSLRSKTDGDIILLASSDELRLEGKE